MPLTCEQAHRLVQRAKGNNTDADASISQLLADGFCTLGKRVPGKVNSEYVDDNTAPSGYK
ncbi:hypothetical protein [Rhodoferax sp. PAMC 29310]|uniref:hypothetical protein n=1 Tax=Rhodoferax sp. PAMC 29310 TaxID=2822760 RepID=UPI001B33DCB9|nr:hypothetical protein [Rhodoferax sp. PAMC 29310]